MDTTMSDNFIPGGAAGGAHAPAAVGGDAAAPSARSNLDPVGLLQHHLQAHVKRAADTLYELQHGAANDAEKVRGCSPRLGD
jgi:hypothetical protein